MEVGPTQVGNDRKMTRMDFQYFTPALMAPPLKISSDGGRGLSHGAAWPINHGDARLPKKQIFAHSHQDPEMTKKIYFGKSSMQWSSS